MRREALLLVLAPGLCAYVGCNQHTEAPPPYAQRCGVVGPVQLLALANTEAVWWRGVTPLDDRYLLGVREYSSPVEDVFDALATPDDLIASRIVSIDECGEGDPIVVAEGVEHVLAPPQAHLPWFACDDETGAFAAIDPSGADAPVWIEPVDSCFDLDIQHETGVVTVQRRADELGGPTDVLQYTFTEGGVSPAVVLESGLMGAGLSYRNDGRFAVGISPERELVQIDLANHVREVVAEDVWDFSWHSDGRYVCVAVGEPDSEDSSLGDVWLLDRETDQLIDVGWSSGERCWHRSVGFATWRNEEGTWPPERTELRRLWEIDAPVVLDGYWDFASRASEDGTLVLTSSDAHGGDPVVAALDPGSNEPRVLASTWAYPYGRVHEGAFYFFEGRNQGSYERPPTTDRRSRLVRVWLDGSGVEEVSPDVFQPLVLPDEHFVTVRGHAHDYHGDLVLTSLAEGDVRLDSDVFLFFARYNPPNAPGWYGGEVHESDTILYSVHHPERNGLWSVTLDLD